MSNKIKDYRADDIRKILSLRAWQMKINELLKEKYFPNNIPIHLCLGHESIATSLIKILKKEDKLSLTHRNCVFNLALANNLEDVLDYYIQKNEGDYKSNMGSMNLALDNTNALYTSSILGNNLSVSLGFAMNKKLKNDKGISIVISGDGAIEEGAFWEYILFAKSHNLKTLLVIENNDYSLASSTKERRTFINFFKICESLEIPFKKSNANNFLNLSKEMAFSYSNAYKGPSIIEIDVKTFNRHAGATPGWGTDPLNISINNGFIIGDETNDPIAQIKKDIGFANYNIIVEEILEQMKNIP